MTLGENAQVGLTLPTHLRRQSDVELTDIAARLDALGYKLAGHIHTSTVSHLFLVAEDLRRFALSFEAASINRDSTGD